MSVRRHHIWCDGCRRDLGARTKAFPDGWAETDAAPLALQIFKARKGLMHYGLEGQQYFRHYCGDCAQAVGCELERMFPQAENPHPTPPRPEAWGEDTKVSDQWGDIIYIPEKP